MSSPTPIKLEFVIGHNANRKTKPSREGFTHDWCLFFRGLSESHEISHFIDKVVFNLHESFPKPRRVVKEAPYVIQESGYAGFVLPIDVHFRNREEPKKVTFQYDLDLQSHKQETKEYIIYNPSDDFRRKCLKGGGFLMTTASVEHKPKESKEISKTSGSAHVTTTSDSKKHKKPEENKSSSAHSFFGNIIKPPTLKPPDSRSSPNPAKSSSSSKSEKNSSTSSKDKIDKEKSKHKHSPSTKDKDSKESRKGEEKGGKSEESKKKDKNKDRDRDRSKDKSSKRSNSPKRRSPSPFPPSGSQSIAQLPSSTFSAPIPPQQQQQQQQQPSATALHQQNISSSATSRNSTNNTNSSSNKNLDKLQQSSSSQKSNAGDSGEKGSSTKKSNKKDKKSYDKDRDRNDKNKKEVKKEVTIAKEKLLFESINKPNTNNSKERDLSSTNKDDKDKFRNKVVAEPKNTNSSTEINPSKKPEKDSADRKHKHKKREKDKKEKDSSKDKKDKKDKEKVSRSFKVATESPVRVSSSPLKIKDSTNTKYDTIQSSAPLPTLPRKTFVESEKESSSEPESPPHPSSVKNESENSNSVPDRPPSVLDIEKSHKRSREKSSKSLEIPSKVMRKEELESVSSPSVSTSQQSSSINNNNNENPSSQVPTITNDYMTELKDLKHKITTLKNNEELQYVVELIAATGCYEITKSTFDFDLCQLDRNTVQRLQEFFTKS